MRAIPSVRSVGDHAALHRACVRSNRGEGSPIAMPTEEASNGASVAAGKPRFAPRLAASSSLAVHTKLRCPARALLNRVHYEARASGSRSPGFRLDTPFGSRTSHRATVGRPTPGHTSCAMAGSIPARRLSSLRH